MRAHAIRLAVGITVLCATPAFADETDQFISWGVELRDSAAPLNEYFNEQMRYVVDHRNGAVQPPCECSSLALNIFDYIFKGRMTSRLMKFMENSDDIEVYPPRTVSRAEFQQMSVYRGLTFPYILPLSRTLRVGDIYFGEDKLGHFLGLGKRYYRHYLWNLKNGAPQDKAIDMAIEWGVLSENTVVGKVVDGIFSHGDLEANYQGLTLARNMCEGANPILRRGEHGWEVTRDIDLRDYINPYWDESYNPCHFWGQRRSLVVPILRDEYAAKAQSPEVLARFRIYAKYRPSRSVEFIRDYFLARGETPQRDQVFIALKLPPGYPIMTMAEIPSP